MRSAVDPIVAVDPDGRVVTWNAGAERVFGARAGDVIGRPLGEIVRAPDGRDVLADAVREARVTGSALLRGAFRCGAGEVDLEVHLVAVGPDAIAVHARDTTDARRLEREIFEQHFALRDATAFLSSVLESVTEHAVLAVDRDGRVVAWNEGARRTYGRAAADVVGAVSVDALDAPGAAGVTQGLVARALATGTAEGESTHARSNGSEFPARLTASVRHDGAGVPCGVVLVAEDESERREAERRIAESLAREELLVDILSHDVKNQLAAAMPRLELLAMRQPAVAPAVERALAPIRRSVAITDDALFLLRLDAEGAPASPVPVGSVARAAVAALEPLASSRGISFRVEDRAVDATASPLLARAVENVLSNAIKWSPAGATVDVAVDLDGEFVRLSVADHGPGIREDQRAQLFGRFRRLDTHGVAGHGLGLAIAKRIVELAGGSIAAEATAGGGATFAIRLPQSPVGPAREGTVAAVAPASR